MKRFSLICAICSIVALLVGCGASKEEVRMSSEIAALKERAESITREATTQKEASAKLIEELREASAKLAENLNAAKTELQLRESEIGRLQVLLAQKDSEISTAQSALASLKSESDKIEQEKARAAKSEPMRKVTTAIRALDVYLKQGISNDQMKSHIAEAVALITEFVSSGQIADDGFAEKARETIRAISDYSYLNEARRRTLAISPTSTSEEYLVEKGSGWDAVARSGFPTTELKRLSEVDRLYSGVTSRCVRWVDLKGWIDKNFITKNLKELTAAANSQP